jgi:hypothetical protein
MALLAFMSHLLLIDEEELSARACLATQQTLAPFSSFYQSISSLLGTSCPPSPVPSSTGQDDDTSASWGKSSEQPILTEETPRMQGPEQTQDTSEDLVPAPVKGELASSEQLVQTSVLLCEQGVCGYREALPWEREETEEEEVASRGGCQELVSAGRGARTIDDLDGHCLTRIMCYLNNPALQACSLVCREWLDISDYARSSMRLQGRPPLAALPSLLLRFEDLRILHFIDGGAQPELDQLAPSPRLDDASMRLIVQCCRRLYRLDLVRCGSFSDAGLAAVLRGCSKMKTLRVSHCGGFSGAGFEGVRCKVEWLDLSFCGGLTSEGLGLAAAACPALWKLNVKMEQADAPLVSGLESVAKRCPALKELTIHVCGVTDATLRSFAASCPLLSDVRLFCEHAITDAGIAALQLHLPRLTGLTLDSNPQLRQIPRSG